MLIFWLWPQINWCMRRIKILMVSLCVLRWLTWSWPLVIGSTETDVNTKSEQSVCVTRPWEEEKGTWGKLCSHHSCYFSHCLSFYWTDASRNWSCVVSCSDFLIPQDAAKFFHRVAEGFWENLFVNHLLPLLWKLAQLSPATVEPTTGRVTTLCEGRGRDKEDGERKGSGVERGVRVLSGE